MVISFLPFSYKVLLVALSSISFTVTVNHKGKSLITHSSLLSSIKDCSPPSAKNKIPSDAKSVINLGLFSCVTVSFTILPDTDIIVSSALRSSYARFSATTIVTAFFPLSYNVSSALVSGASVTFTVIHSGVSPTDHCSLVSSKNVCSPPSFVNSNVSVLRSVVSTGTKSSLQATNATNANRIA